jgi:hypothetical protein
MNHIRYFKPKTSEAKDKLRNVIGINYVDHELETLKLSFDISQKTHLLSLPLHISKKKTNPDSGKHSTLYYECIPI